MPHITLPPNAPPGIRGLMSFRPETSKPLLELAEVLLRGPSTLGRGERELIAALVSSRNSCGFCTRSHSAVAAAQLAGGAELAEAVCRDFRTAQISERLKALLAIAEQVQQSGQHVQPTHLAAARAAGATDLELHDTVLIAAAFSMFNRYVDGLGAVTPDDPMAYQLNAKLLVEKGYAR